MKTSPQEKHIKLPLTAILLLPLATVNAQQPPPGFADSVLGRWNLTVESSDDSYPSWLEVQLRTEWQLMGRFVGQFGSARHITAIDYDNGRLEFRVPVQYEQNPDDLHFVGTLEDDRLAGTTVDTSGKTLTWSAVRAPSLERQKPPKWGEPLELWNGRDLNDWRPRSNEQPGCWTVKDNLLVATPPCVDLISKHSFEDFRMQVEFKYPEGSNSGLYLRGRYEVQIQDDIGKAIDPLRIGSVYGFVAPSANAARAANEWQVYDITLIGRRITVVLNGKTIVDGQIVPGITGGALDSNEGLPGPLMLQGDHGPISFRKITLTPAQ
jgi:hypothetical protein